MNSTRNNLILLICAVLGIGVLYLLYSKEDTIISSFEECKAAGYAIIETYPEQCKTPAGVTFVHEVPKVPLPPTSTTTPVTTGKEDIIRVDTVHANQIIQSPLTVSGNARGPWFFEASFPVELLDANGKTIASKAATTNGNWMSENFVPFSVTLLFGTPATSDGTLVLHKDNPSGDPKRDDSLRIPVRFMAE